jgi:hypothetical protein
VQFASRTGSELQHYYLLISDLAAQPKKFTQTFLPKMIFAWEECLVTLRQTTCREVKSKSLLRTDAVARPQRGQAYKRQHCWATNRRTQSSSIHAQSLPHFVLYDLKQCWSEIWFFRREYLLQHYLAVLLTFLPDRLPETTSEKSRIFFSLSITLYLAWATPSP